MKRSLITLLLTSAALAILGFAAIPARAQATVSDLAQGEVRKIDRDAKKITLKHGPIKSLDMPPMTMVFQVRDPALFDKLTTGDQVRFSVEDQQGALVLTTLEKATPK